MSRYTDMLYNDLCLYLISCCTPQTHDSSTGTNMWFKWRMLRYKIYFPLLATGWCHPATYEALQRQALHTLWSQHATHKSKRRLEITSKCWQLIHLQIHNARIQLTWLFHMSCGTMITCIFLPGILVTDRTGGPADVHLLIRPFNKGGQRLLHIQIFLY